MTDFDYKLETAWKFAQLSDEQFDEANKQISDLIKSGKASRAVFDFWVVLIIARDRWKAEQNLN